eukprot:6929394-Alexandrium_andersonii.AAC.1
MCRGVLESGPRRRAPDTARQPSTTERNAAWRFNAPFSKAIVAATRSQAHPESAALGSLHQRHRRLPKESWHSGG